MPEKSEEQLLEFVNDYISGHFTIQSEKPLIEEIIRLASPSLSPNDVFEVLFEGDVTTPAEGVDALRAFAQANFGIQYLSAPNCHSNASVASRRAFVKQPPI